MPKLSICPFSLSIFLGTALYTTLSLRRQQKKLANAGQRQVVFVLGGPGAGKGTQCELLVQRLPGPPWVHLSAGDLLRAERRNAANSELGALIEARISSGQLVPSSVTCQLIQNAMDEYASSKHGIRHFLVDGYPRSAENQSVWESQVGSDGTTHVAFVLFFECPEEVLTGRLLERGKQGSGRVDDGDLAIIRQRFRTYAESTAPIVAAYERLGKVHRVPADRPVEDVYNTTAQLFASLSSS
jgi:UMP-CMP kinase